MNPKLDYIFTRRSVRAYQAKLVGDDLVRDVLDLGRSQMGQLALTRELLNLAAGVQAIRYGRETTHHRRSFDAGWVGRFRILVTTQPNVHPSPAVGLGDCRRCPECAALDNCAAP